MINKQKLSPMFQTFKEDFQFCEQIIKEHSKSFYAAFSTLPKQKAMSVYAIYPFCRLADDIVDEEANLAKLNQLEEELKLFEQGREVDHPIWRALRVVFSTYKMDINPFYDMITGQKMDLNFTQPQTQKELEEYSYYVAGSVGLMMLPLLTDDIGEIQEEAIALGTAMQITNILRDIGEDLQNNRVYLPVEIMENHGYTSRTLEHKLINDAFINLWEFEASEAEKHYESALRMLPFLNQEAKRPLLLSLLFYREILEAVRESNYQCYTKRNHVSKKRKLQLLQVAEDILMETTQL